LPRSYSDTAIAGVPRNDALHRGADRAGLPENVRTDVRSVVTAGDDHVGVEPERHIRDGNAVGWSPLDRVAGVGLGVLHRRVPTTRARAADAGLVARWRDHRHVVVA